MTAADDDDRLAERVLDLDHLCRLALRRKSVICPSSRTYGHRPQPAAWVLNQSGTVLRHLFNAGLYRYRGSKERRR